MAAAVYTGLFPCKCLEASRRGRSGPFTWERDRGCRSEARDAQGRPRIVARWRGREYGRCPAALVPAWTAPLLRQWEQFSEHGTLPGPGGTHDHPALWLDAMYAITQAVGEARAELQSGEERFAGLPVVRRR